LIADGAGHASEERGDFAAGLAKAENVIDEQERVFASQVAKILGHGEGRECDAEAGAGRFVHLAENHAGLLDDVAARVTDLGLLHFEPEVGAFASALANAGKYRVAAVGTGDAGDEFGQNNRLAEASATEQAGFAAADEGGEQVDDFDASLEQLGAGGKLGNLR
jgi:hypothetical protein